MGVRTGKLFQITFLSKLDTLGFEELHLGTCSNCRPHPVLATIPEETKKVLERLANLSDVFVGVISGRGVNNVREMVGIQGITYAGNHGLELLHPDGTRFTHPMRVGYKEKLKALEKELTDNCTGDGAWVEPKGS